MNFYFYTTLKDIEKKIMGGENYSDIRRFFELIEDGDVEGFQKHCFVYDFTDLNEDSFMKLVFMILDFCVKSKSEITQDVFNCLENNNIKERELPLSIAILCNLLFTKEFCAKLFKRCESVTYYEVMRVLPTMEQSEELRIALAKVSYIWKSMYPIETYIDLYNFANKHNNTLVIQYLEEIISKKKKVIGKPKWMSKFPIQELKLRPDRDDAFGILLEKYKKQIGISLNDEEKKKLRERIDTMDNEEFNLFVEDNCLLEYRLKLRESENRFRICGPINNSVDLRDVNHVCAEMGGCSMFYCNCFEIDDEIPDAKKDWYTGACRNCFSKISSKRRATRIPIVPGGWYGCFCSFSCQIEYINTYVDWMVEETPNGVDPEDSINQASEEVVETKIKTSELLKTRIEEVKRSLFNIGIHDDVRDNTPFSDLDDVPETMYEEVEVSGKEIEISKQDLILDNNLELEEYNENEEDEVIIV